MDRMTNYLKPESRHTARLVLICLALAAVSIWLGLVARAEHGRATTWNAQEKSLRTANRPKPAPSLSKTQVEDLKRWNVLKAERGFNWEPVFVAVERAGNADIELLAFQPDKPARQLVLRGEAKDGLAVVEFIERLGRQRNLMNVHLTRQKNMQRARMMTIAFEIRATLAH
ncbi:hypothetical protein ACN9MY_15015 [Pseudoduganella sp. R-31]|uniref:hypothetical protein n=1 Tax=Pseudoduganella sp. R-31 TaxID=3404060 RepID=UPI003CEF8E4C